MSSASKTTLSNVARKSRRLAVILALGLLVGASVLPASAYADSAPTTPVHVTHIADGGSGDNPPGPE